MAILIALIFLGNNCLAKTPNDLSFKPTVDLVLKSLLDRDMENLNAHVDVGAIVKSKIKKYSSKAQSKGILMKSAGKFINFSEPMITGSIVKLTLSEYSKSSYELRKAYIDNISVNQIAYASGVFLRKPFFASALKVNGKWVINSIESEWIDIEIKNALRAMHVI